MAINYELATQLQMTLDRQLEFVKYIEGKCIALLTASTALLAVATATFLDQDYAGSLPDSFDEHTVLLVSCVLFLCIAFIPLDVRPRVYNGYSMPGGNLFFFGDAAKMRPDDFRKALQAIENNETEPSVATMLCDQIIINGKICVPTALSLASRSIASSPRWPRHLWRLAFG